MKKMLLGRREAMAGLSALAVSGLVSPAMGAVRPRSRPDTLEAISTDGLRLRGEATGDPGAPEILFVHGLRQSRLSWERQIDASALAGFRKVRFDLRGHGDSDKPEDPRRYADPALWADDLAAMIGAARLRRPIVVGWSLGGFVVGSYLWRHGDARVSGINLVDAVIAPSPDLLTPLAGSFARSTGSHDLGERTTATTDFLLACFEHPPRGADLQRMMVVNGMAARAVNEGFLAGDKPDLLTPLSKSRKPLLLSHGAHDRLVRVAMSERVRASRTDAPLSLYRGSGHCPFWEEPERFNRELAAFATAAWKAA